MQRNLFAIFILPIDLNDDNIRISIKRKEGGNAVKHQHKVMAIAISAVFCLSGCQASTMPAMTEEQTDLVAQYAANLILTNNKKYDTGIATQAEIEKADAKRERQRLREEEAKKTSEATGETGQAETETTATVSENADIAQFLGLQDIAITYQSYEICNAYPNNNSEENFFAMDATEGNQLLVLKFMIQNNGTEDKEMDILNQYPLFRISVSGGADKSALTTILLDDLSTFKDTLAAGESREEVLVTEISNQEAEEGIQSLSLLMKLNNQSANTNLQ